MTTQVPPGPENAVAPHEYPQFVMGYAQYPPPLKQEHAPPQPISAPPATYPPAAYPGAGHPPATYPGPTHPAAAEGHPANTYPTVSYPQQGAPGYPEPVPYPQPGIPLQAAHPQPGTYPPPAAYPTAPPWAAEQQHPATDPAAPPGQPLPAQYGGLLVPYPDKMQHASRAQPPAVWPVAAFTLLSGLLGLISAKRRADQARRTRNSSAPYWITFLVSAVAGAFIWFVVGAVVVGPVLTEIRENDRLEAVQRNVLGDGQLKDARIAVTAAQCRAVSERDAAGMRDYLCRLTLDDGHTASLSLTADETGQWHSTTGK